jgi:hypothetical protein
MVLQEDDVLVCLIFDVVNAEVVGLFELPFGVLLSQFDERVLNEMSFQFLLTSLHGVSNFFLGVTVSVFFLDSAVCLRSLHFSEFTDNGDISDSRNIVLAAGCQLIDSVPRALDRLAFFIDIRLVLTFFRRVTFVLLIAHVLVSTHLSTDISK